MQFLSSNNNNNNNNNNSNIYAFNNFFNTLSNNTCHDRFMHLKLFIDYNDINDATEAANLKQININSAANHNQKILSDPHFFDAGFDIYLPSDTVFHSGQTNKVDFKVKCCAKIHYLSTTDTSRSYFTGFYTHPRSSLSKTPLRLANSTGIIDAGYRGNLIGMFDCNSNNDYTSYQLSRLLQICAPNLMPIFVEIVDTIEALGPNTSRGTGGIGSTGI